MTYATQQNLIDRFGSEELLSLTDPANTGTINATTVNTALSDAEEVVNGYIAAKVDLPLVNTPAILVHLECDIARYLLYGAYPTDLVKERFEEAKRTLRDIGKGIFSLGLDQANHDVVVNSPAFIESSASVFGRDQY